MLLPTKFPDVPAPASQTHPNLTESTQPNRNEPIKHEPVSSPEDSDAEDDIANEEDNIVNGDVDNGGVIDLGEDYEGDEEHILIF